MCWPADSVTWSIFIVFIHKLHDNEIIKRPSEGQSPLNGVGRVIHNAWQSHDKSSFRPLRHRSAVHQVFVDRVVHRLQEAKHRDGRRSGMIEMVGIKCMRNNGNFSQSSPTNSQAVFGQFHHRIVNHVQLAWLGRCHYQPSHQLIDNGSIYLTDCCHIRFPNVLFYVHPVQKGEIDGRR